MDPKLRDIEAFKALPPAEIGYRRLRELEPADVQFLCEAIDAGDFSIETKAYETHLSQAQQARVMRYLLDGFKAQGEELQDLIISACVRAILGYWCCFEAYIDVLLVFHQRPGVDAVVDGATSRILFGKELLEAMHARKRYPRAWATTIRRRLDQRDFSDDRVYFDERLPPLTAALELVEPEVQMRHRDCQTCGSVPEKIDEQTMHEPTLPEGILRIRELSDQSYRDEAGDLCQRTETLYRCGTCEQYFRHVMDTDMQVVGWSTAQRLTPISEAEAAGSLQ